MCPKERACVRVRDGLRFCLPNCLFTIHSFICLSCPRIYRVSPVLPAMANLLAVSPAPAIHHGSEYTLLSPCKEDGRVGGGAHMHPPYSFHPPVHSSLDRATNPSSCRSIWVFVLQSTYLSVSSSASPVPASLSSSSIHARALEMHPGA